MTRKCGTPGCGQDYHARDMCRAEYETWYWGLVRNQGRRLLPSQRLQSGPRSRVRPEDVEELLEFGERPEGIARRLGVKRPSVIRALQRQGRADLAARLYAESHHVTRRAA